MPMVVRTEAIVLHTTQYNASYSIAHIYTRDYGRLGVLLPYKRKLRSGHHLFFAPLTELELVLDLKAGRDLAYLRDAKLLAPRHSLHSVPAKSSQVLFLSELLYRVLTHSESDVPLYEFLSLSLATFEQLTRGVANFYLYLTYRLLHHLAIAPDLMDEATSAGHYFDLVDGCYTFAIAEGHPCLTIEETKHLRLFARINLTNLAAYRYNRYDRALILDRLLQFYRLHLPPFPALRSLEILRATTTTQGRSSAMS